MQIQSNIEVYGSHLQHNESLAISASVSAPLTFAKLLPQPFQVSTASGTPASSSGG